MKLPAGGFDLHAWVEQGGHVVNDNQSHVMQYQPLWDLINPDKLITGRVQ